MKTTVISVLGTQKDAHGGAGKARWDTWRPNIGLVQQEELPIDELHLILNREYLQLAERVNDSDRLTKYLARFGLKFKEIAKA